MLIRGVSQRIGPLTTSGAQTGVAISTFKWLGSAYILYAKLTDVICLQVGIVVEVAEAKSAEVLAAYTGAGLTASVLGRTTSDKRIVIKVSRCCLTAGHIL
jgi:phosphoribosylaminoimidazole (AIR) synthetase